MILGKRSAQVLFSVCALGVLVGCGDEAGTGATTGELGNATFDYNCVNSGDLKCSQLNEIDEFELGTDLGSRSSIPEAVATGSIFGISFEGTQRDNGDEEAVTLSSVSSPDEIATNRFSVAQPVEAGFLATTSSGDVVDLLHVTVLEATTLGVWRDQRELETLEINVGDSVDVTVAPRAENGVFLAGAMPYRWVSSDSSVVGLGAYDDGEADNDEVTNEGDVTIAGVAEGTSRLVVSSGDLSTTIEVEVSP